MANSTSYQTFLNLKEMKKKFLGFAIIAIGIIGFGVSMNESSSRALFSLKNVEALASSEKGCINRSPDNNGDCTNDGKLFFCEDSIVFHDCVKGEYPK